MSILQNQKLLFSHLATIFENFENLYDQKMWYQLSLSLEEFMSKQCNHHGNLFYQLYQHFIVLFEDKLNKLHLISIISKVGMSFESASEAYIFLSSFLNSHKEMLGLEAAIAIEMDISSIRLKLGETEVVKENILSAKSKIDQEHIQEPNILSKFYFVCMEYYKLSGPAAEYYKSSLLFLSHTSLENLSENLKSQISIDMALASISSSDIFNFGEVISTPIFKYLKNTSYSWLYELIFAMNNGDIDKFNMIVDSKKSEYFNEPSLSHEHENIKKKLALLCLVNIAFESPSNNRVIKFNEISFRTKLPIDQVEWLVIRSFSLGLLRGTIDEVEKQIEISWVQPRILEGKQIQKLVLQIDEWNLKVKETMKLMEDQTIELFA